MNVHTDCLFTCRTVSLGEGGGRRKGTRAEVDCGDAEGGVEEGGREVGVGEEP